MCVCEHVRTREKRELVVIDGERQWERESERVAQVWKPSSRPSANTHLEQDMSEGRGRGRPAGEECEERRRREADRLKQQQRKRAAHLTEGVEEVRESQPLVWGAGGGERKKKGISWIVMSQGGGLHYKADPWLPRPRLILITPAVLPQSDPDSLPYSSSCSSAARWHHYPPDVGNTFSNRACYWGNPVFDCHKSKPG